MSFNNIGHAALMQAVGNFPARELITPWLKAGYVEDEMLHPTDTGVPPGGVMSPLLLNVALHGMEPALGISYIPQGVRRGRYAFVRYADDLAVLCPPMQEAIEAKDILATGRGTRGLRLSEEKTPIRHLSAGFNFLGFTSRHDPAPHSARSGAKLLMTPRQDSIQQIRRKLKARWRTHVGSPTVALINAMHPVIRGWSQYCRSGVAQQVLTDLDNFMYERAQRYMKRRHPTKSGWWRTQKSWGRTIGDRQARRVFQDKARKATLRKFAWTRMVRHRLVPKTYAPDDPTLQDYWRQRRNRSHALAGRQRPLATRQQGRCPVCHQPFDTGEALHVHQVLPKKHGGTDELTNLRLVQANCHRQLHSTSAPLGVRRWLEPCTR